jgi:hypothetical protein
MARHYSIRSFFRQIPNTLLARYFNEWGLFQELHFAAMKETAPDALFAAWLGLSEGQRSTIDAQSREIFDLCCETGFKAIVDEAEWHLGAGSDAMGSFMAVFAESPNHYHSAMLVYLDYREYWKGATRFYHADTLPYWRKRAHMGHAPAAVDDASLQRLAEGIRAYFRETEGRGNNCVVEPFRRGDLDYFFAYPEDYSKQSVEWVNGTFDIGPHNPAFEVVFVYSRKDGTLDVNVPGSKKVLEPLQGIFATTILNLDALPPNPKDTRVYELNLLRERDFRFVYDPGSGIERVTIRKLRMSSRLGDRNQNTLEADSDNNPLAIYDLMETVGKAVPLHHYDVTQAELTVSIVEDVRKRPKRVTVRITHPQSCSLKYDERDLKLRAMLERSGLEPREQDDPVPEAP